jgi:hypothetical protein
LRFLNGIEKAGERKKKSCRFFLIKKQFIEKKRKLQEAFMIVKNVKRFGEIAA